MSQGAPVTPRRSAREYMTILESPPQPASANGRTTAVVGGLAAALVGGGAMLLLRSGLQVRSIPERLMEWILLFVPPGIFEWGLQVLGFEAKRYTLYLAILVVLGLWAWLGYDALRRRWPVRTIGVLGIGIWLAVMLVVMPLTSAGIFALDLRDGSAAAIGGYLAVGLSYAAVLALFRMRNVQPERHEESRRIALGLLGGAVVSSLATYLAVRLLPHQAGLPTVVLEDPQQPVPSGGIDPPNPHPSLVEAAGAPAPAPIATDAPSVGSLPEPTTTRVLKRDNAGAIVPAGRVRGQLTRPITANEDFYVVTKNAGGDPELRPSDWRLQVDGEVSRAFQLDYATLRKLPSVEVTRTLECISNFVGKPELAPFGAELISTAVWKGVAVRDVLALVGGPSPGAAWVVVFGADEYTSALPLDVMMDPATLLVYEMNGEVLPHEHGYPVRLLVPDRYGMKNPKWLVGLRVMKREFNDWYGQRNWSKTAIVQTMSRIDSPAPDTMLAPGTHTVAGIAFAGSRGISAVEYSVDDGKIWQRATLSTSGAGVDHWFAWQGNFDVAAGSDARIVARATDGAGVVQTEAFGLPEPDGGTGWPRIGVRAS
ncbi:MAG TPA: molybdopterin-dependent oxidoreductase [Chloroflexota bacterium]|nr:molybdopterin-dependent oxidoreductase [Chloroflexota bacterium]